MKDIKDERGFNQIFKDALATKIRKERRCDYIIDQMDNKNLTNKNILEIGCGTGEGLKYIFDKTGSNCLGIDLSEKFVSIANKNYKNLNLNFKVADFNKQDFFLLENKSYKFDYVIGNGILHHLYYNLDNSLINLRKLLKPEGKIIFIEPNIFNPYVALIFKIPFLRKKTFLEPDEMAFSANYIRKKLLATNFIICKIETKDFLLPNTPDLLINPIIKLGNLLENTPIKYIAQSIFISAKI
jgi:2-polyprenyl-3-methyl-5-hydroxy-6-metoxy-1,4-benzoquinol methylase